MHPTMSDRLRTGLLFLALIAACAPAADSARTADSGATTAAAAPSLATQWEPADAPGQSALAWMADGATVILSCTMACDPTARPGPDEPQPLCTEPGATFMVAATAPPGSPAQVGDSAALRLGANRLAGVLSASEETQPGMVELRLPLDAGVVRALRGATTAQVAVGGAVVSAGTDTAGRFAQLAESCRVLGRVK